MQNRFLGMPLPTRSNPECLKVGLIGTYPPIITSNDYIQTGMAPYMQKLVSALPRDGFHYQVFASHIPGEPDHVHIDDHIEIIRCWERRLSFSFQILRALKKYRPDIVHFLYEFSQFGPGLTVFLHPMLLLGLKLLRIPVITSIVAIPSLKIFDRKFLETYRLGFVPSFTVKAAFWFLTYTAAVLSQVVVVCQTGGEAFAKTLVDEYNVKREKIVVTPMPSEKRYDKLERYLAREHLNIPEEAKVLLFFGFLTGYKGVEVLIDAFSILAQRYPEMRLIIAGDDTPHFNPRSNGSYLMTLQERALATGTPIHFTGYVPESDVTVYFSAADLLILPYIAGTSSSGPLVIATAYDCPFIISTAMSRVVDYEPVLFEPEVEILVHKVENFFGDPKQREKTIDYIRKFKHDYSWEKLAQDTSFLYRRLRVDSQMHHRRKHNI